MQMPEPTISTCATTAHSSVFDGSMEMEKTVQTSQMEFARPHPLRRRACPAAANFRSRSRRLIPGVVPQAMPLLRQPRVPLVPVFPTVQLS